MLVKPILFEKNTRTYNNIWAAHQYVQLAVSSIIRYTLPRPLMHRSTSHESKVFDQSIFVSFDHMVFYYNIIHSCLWRFGVLTPTLEHNNPCCVWSASE